MKTATLSRLPGFEMFKVIADIPAIINSTAMNLKNPLYKFILDFVSNSRYEKYIHFYKNIDIFTVA